MPKSTADDARARLKDFTIVRYIYDEKAFGNEIVEARKGDLDVRIVQDRGTLEFSVKQSNVTEWLDFGLVYRFISGRTDELCAEKVYQFIGHRYSDIERSLRELTGALLAHAQAEELLGAREALAKAGVITRDHPLYVEALEALRAGKI